MKNKIIALTLKLIFATALTCIVMISMSINVEVGCFLVSLLSAKVATDEYNKIYSDDDLERKE